LKGLRRRLHRHSPRPLLLLPLAAPHDEDDEQDEPGDGGHDDEYEGANVHAGGSKASDGAIASGRGGQSGGALHSDTEGGRGGGRGAERCGDARRDLSGGLARRDVDDRVDLDGSSTDRHLDRRGWHARRLGNLSSDLVLYVGFDVVNGASDDELDDNDLGVFRPRRSRRQARRR